MPGNAGQGVQSVMLNERLRFEHRPGEFGRLYDLQSDGQWVAREGVYVGLPAAGGGFIVLDPQAQARDRAPITTPALPPGDTSPPPLPIAPQAPGTPGYEAQPPSGPDIETLPAAPPLTWQELLIEQRNSQELGDNLRASGVYPPDAPDGGATSYEPHHIVPSRASGAEMDIIRDRLAALGVDLNDEANGVWLPSARTPGDAPEAYHPRLNNRSYNNAVIQELTGVTTREQAIRALADIAARLRTGDFPGVRPRP